MSDEMDFIRILEQKKRFLPLLLDADPSEAMIDRYLHQGELFLLGKREQPLCVAVVLPLHNRQCELKNIATAPCCRRQGIGSLMLRHLFAHYTGQFDEMLVGTSKSAAPFYQKNGFVFSHTVPGFFTSYYPEPIWEDGVQCIDMIYFVRKIGKNLS